MEGGEGDGGKEGKGGAALLLLCRVGRGEARPCAIVIDEIWPA